MLVATKGNTHTETDLQTNLSLPQAVKELKSVLETFKEQPRNLAVTQYQRPASCVLWKRCSKSSGIPKKPFLTEDMLKAHNYVENELCR